MTDDFGNTQSSQRDARKALRDSRRDGTFNSLHLTGFQSCQFVFQNVPESHTDQATVPKAKSSKKRFAIDAEKSQHVASLG